MLLTDWLTDCVDVRIKDRANQRDNKRSLLDQPNPPPNCPSVRPSIRLVRRSLGRVILSVESVTRGIVVIVCRPSRDPVALISFPLDDDDYDESATAFWTKWITSSPQYFVRFYYYSEIKSIEMEYRIRHNHQARQQNKQTKINKFPLHLFIFSLFLGEGTSSSK